MPSEALAALALAALLAAGCRALPDESADAEPDLALADALPVPDAAAVDDGAPIADTAPIARPGVPLAYATVRADCHDLDDLIIGIGEYDIACDDDADAPALLWIHLTDAAATPPPFTVAIGADLPGRAEYNANSGYEPAIAGTVQVEAYDADGGATGRIALEFADGRRLEGIFDARRCPPGALDCSR